MTVGAGASVRGAGRSASCEDPAFIRTPRLCYRRRRFEESASEARHLFDDLLAESVRILRSCEVLDVIGESPNDSQLRSKTGESNLGGESVFVVRFESAQRGHGCKHRPPARCNRGAMDAPIAWFRKRSERNVWSNGERP
jgi:hypothetical protein